MTTWIVEWDGCPAWFKNGTKTLYDWWMVERVHKVVETGVPNKEQDLVIFASASVPLVVNLGTDGDLLLGYYVCVSVSLTEDQ